MRIIGRAEWGARHDDGAGPAPLPAREVWLHHVGPGRELTADATEDAEAEHMRRLEAVGESRFGRGFSYTFAVYPSGRVYVGHSVDRKGTHTRGRNSVARAILWPGDHRRTTPTQQQIEATAELLAHGHRSGWWLHARIDGGHRVAPGAATECPGDLAVAAISAVNRRAADLLARAPDPIPSPSEDDMPEICRSVETNTLWAVSALGRRAIEARTGPDGQTVRAIDHAAFLVGMGWARWPDGKPRDVPKAILDGIPRLDVR